MPLSSSSSSSSLIVHHLFPPLNKPHHHHVPSLLILSGCLNIINYYTKGLNINIRKNSCRHSIINYDYHHNHDDAELEQSRFEEAVALFNNREYYKCHDFLEQLWYVADEPARTLLHAILQCSVGFHHLFNQNHRGAMMELGEGLCKLRKVNFGGEGPFYLFEQEISACLDFIYQTQLELAACGDDLCLTMDGSERSYQLLGSFGAGQHLYSLEMDGGDHQDVPYIVFCPDIGSGSSPLDNKPSSPSSYSSKNQASYPSCHKRTS
ncbi:hypothetical protein Syun_031204 [Stephania yunnanensis]|uniref:DUF309 domain-containing protein n=1 Tax=Stephania yunnanensis TaxID=152371 RepID=A0AAP0E326_9MAGN